MKLFLNACRDIVGAAHVLTKKDTTPYLTDWCKSFTGAAQAVVRPSSTEEVASVVRLCVEHQVPIVPQGGNTSLVIGSVPDSSGNAIVLSLTRLNRVRSIDAINHTIIVESGCILDTVKDAASEVGLLFPLSLASSGSCTIGGNLSSNAGGAAGLRYGSARELCLGLEVVTPQGEVWNGLRRLRKNNTGYNLRDIYIGAEGTLGIITAAVLKLFPQTKARVTALVGLNTTADALHLFSIARRYCDAALTGFELMSDCSMQLVMKHFPEMLMPLTSMHRQYVLLEISDTESESHAMSRLEAVIGSAIEEDVVQDAVVASSIAQANALWKLLGLIFPAQAMEGKSIRHDIAVPTSRVADFIELTDALLQKSFPGCRIVTFGHLGDGSLHYNVFLPEVSLGKFLTLQTEVNRMVHDSVDKFNGSISPEFGIGSLKRDELLIHKSSFELDMMLKIKQAIDPDHLMNPGKMFVSSMVDVT